MSTHQAIPHLIPVVRKYQDTTLPDCAQSTHDALCAADITGRVRPGMRVALAVGSRGIHAIADIVRVTAEWFRSQGAVPFIVPAMGSHGGGNADEQRKILHDLGVTEAYTQCEIVSGMEVTQVGTLSDEIPVYVDTQALTADGIFVINRVKPHTAFHGMHESGLVKMLAVGLGKHVGAELCHAHGFGKMADIMPRMAQVVLANAPIVGALGIVENSYDRAAVIQAATADSLFTCDASLLEQARTNMPSLPVKELDILLVDQMGKNISGAGMDCAITGRYAAPGLSGEITVNKLVVLDLTPASKGNALGIGHADITTRRLVDSIDYQAMYTNAITATLLKPAFVPLVAETDYDALDCAIKTCNAVMRPLRMIRICNTLRPDVMLVSPEIAMELGHHQDCTVLESKIALEFSPAGLLLHKDIWQSL